MTMQPIISSRAPGTRGFAAMDQEKQRAIARRGGLAAQALGTAHRFSSEEARSAGRKGGEAVSGNRQHMASIGRRGGVARHALRKAQGPQPADGHVSRASAPASLDAALDAANEIAAADRLDAADDKRRSDEFAIASS